MLPCLSFLFLFLFLFLEGESVKPSFQDPALDIGQPAGQDAVAVAEHIHVRHQLHAALGAYFRAPPAPTRAHFAVIPDEFHVRRDARARRCGQVARSPGASRAAFPSHIRLSSALRLTRPRNIFLPPRPSGPYTKASMRRHAAEY